MAPKELIFGSFNPDEMASGGGLPSNFDGTVVDAQYCRFDYRGTKDAVVAAKLTIKPDDVNQLEEAMREHLVDGNVVEMYKVADITEWAPYDTQHRKVVDFDEYPDGEGQQIVSIGDQSKLAKNSKFGEFIAVALDAGMPKELSGTDLSKLVGVNGHWDRLESKSAKSAQKADKKAGDRKYAVEILVLSKFEEVKGQAKSKSASKGTSATGKASAASASASSSNGDGDLEVRVVAAIVELLGEKGATKKAVLGSQIIKQFENNEMKPVLKLAADVAFLSDESRPWEFNEKSGLVSPIGG